MMTYNSLFHAHQILFSLISINYYDVSYSIIRKVLYCDNGDVVDTHYLHIHQIL